MGSMDVSLARPHACVRLTVLLILALLANLGTAPSASCGMVSYWTFDTQWKQGYDSAGSNNGTLVNGPIWSGNGKVGAALTFNGVDRYVNCGAGASLILSSAVSAAAWIYVPVAPIEQTFWVLNRRTSGNQDAYAIYIDSFMKPIFRTANGPSNTELKWDTALSTGTWYHIAATYNGTHKVLYVDGQQRVVGEATGNLDTGAGTFLIGVSETGDTIGAFKGTIDEVAVFDRALEAYEVKELYQNGQNGQGYCASWTKSSVNSDIGTTADLDAAKVNGDAAMDLVAVAGTSDTVSWYELEEGSWTKRAIEDSETAAGYAVEAANLDGDGDNDVVTSIYWTLGAKWTVTWYENTAGDGSTWTKADIDANLGTGVTGFVEVHAADMDGDDDLDVVAASRASGKVLWYRNGDGSGGGDGSSWTPGTVADPFGKPGIAPPIDVDGDGDRDVVAVDTNGGKVSWFDNNEWAEHVIDTGVTGGGLGAGDLDGDGDTDVVGYRSGIVWWAGSSNGTSWTRHDIDTGLSTAYSMKVTDMDGDGDLDVLVGCLFDGVLWLENTGSGWTRHRVDGLYVSPTGLHVESADMDGDGTQEVLGSSPTTTEIAWWVADVISPTISLTSLGGDTTPPLYTTDATPAIVIGTTEAASCRVGLEDEGYDGLSDDIACSSADGTSHTCQMPSLMDKAGLKAHVSCRDGSGNDHDGAGVNFDIPFEVNLPPTSPSIALNGTTVRTDDWVNCSISSASSDPGNDPITYYYKFNDTSGTTLQDWSTSYSYDCGAAGCDKNDGLMCWTKATTPLLNSSAVKVVTTILDTLPTLPGISVNDTRIETDELFKCNLDTASSDADDDAITYEYLFNDTNSGTLKDWSSSNEFSCATNGCDHGDTIYCYARAVTEDGWVMVNALNTVEIVLKCGNGVCDNSEGESCYICPIDCNCESRDVPVETTLSITCLDDELALDTPGERSFICSLVPQGDIIRDVKVTASSPHAVLAVVEGERTVSQVGGEVDLGIGGTMKALTPLPLTFTAKVVEGMCYEARTGIEITADFITDGKQKSVSRTLPVILRTGECVPGSFSSREMKARFALGELRSFCGVNITLINVTEDAAVARFLVQGRDGTTEEFATGYAAVQGGGLEEMLTMGPVTLVVRDDCFNSPTLADLYVLKGAGCVRQEVIEALPVIEVRAIGEATIRTFKETGEVFVLSKGTVVNASGAPLEELSGAIAYDGKDILPGGMQGFLELDIPFDKVELVPATGYVRMSVPAEPGKVYAVLTDTGTYALIGVRELHSVEFDWAYQPDGSRGFVDPPDLGEPVIGVHPFHDAQNVHPALSEARIILAEGFLKDYRDLTGRDVGPEDITATMTVGERTSALDHRFDVDRAIILDLEGKLPYGENVTIHVRGLVDPFDRVLLDRRWSFTTADEASARVTWLEPGIEVSRIVPPGGVVWFGFNLTLISELELALSLDVDAAVTAARVVTGYDERDVISTLKVGDGTARGTVALTLTEGTYLVPVRSPASGSPVDVSLMLDLRTECIHCRADEAGNVLETAERLPVNTTVEGYVPSTNPADSWWDEDWYELIIDDNVTMSLGLDAPGGDTDHRVRARLLDKNRTLIGEVVARAEAPGEMTDRLPPGDYFVHISPVGLTGLYRYAVRVNISVIVPDPCAGVTCKDNEECVDGSCQCLTGFKECRGECVQKDDCCSDDDCPSGSTCLANGTCEVTEIDPDDAEMSVSDVDTGDESAGLEHATLEVRDRNETGEGLSFVPLAVVEVEGPEAVGMDLEFIDGHLRTLERGAGVQVISDVSFEELGELPAYGYAENVTVAVGTVIGVRTSRGTYAKGVVRSLNGTSSMTVEWVLQTDGSRRVGTSPSISTAGGVQDVVEEIVETIKDKPVQSVVAGATAVAVGAGAMKVVGALGAAAGAAGASGSAGAASATTASLSSAMAAGASVSGGAAGTAATTAAGSAAAGTASAVAASTGSATAAASAVQSIGGQGVALIAKQKAYSMAMNKVQDKIKDQMVDKGVRHLANKCAATALLVQADQMEGKDEQDIAETYRIANQMVIMLYRSPQTTQELSMAMWGGDKDYAKPIIEKLVLPLDILLKDEPTGIYSLTPEEYQRMQRWLRAEDLTGELSILMDSLTGDVGLGTIKTIKQTYDAKWKKKGDEEEEDKAQCDGPPAYFKELADKEGVRVLPLVDKAKRKATNELEEALAAGLSERKLTDLASECALGTLFSDRYRSTSAVVAKQISDAYQILLLLYMWPMTEEELDQAIWKKGSGKAGEYLPGMVEKGWVVGEKKVGVYSLNVKELGVTDSFLDETGLRTVIGPPLARMLRETEGTTGPVLKKEKAAVKKAKAGVKKKRSGKRTRKKGARK